MNANTIASPDDFNYEEAFSRNLGWLTPEDLKILSSKKLALPGLGGVGGHHLHNFLRLGVQHFHIADFDTYSLSNFNRQLGANTQTIGRPKTDVMLEMAKNINPNSKITVFENGVTKENCEEFLEGVDLIVDTLDLYAMDIRIKLYDIAHDLGIPIITAGPFGMGTSVMAFSPKKTKFSDFFQLNEEGINVEEQMLRFVGTLTPLDILLGGYLVHEEGLNTRNKTLPSLNIGCDAAAAALGTLSLKILLNRPGIIWAPKGFYVDFYLHKSRILNLPKGAAGWKQKMKLKALRKKHLLKR